jgi:micrococcal nuclease
MSRKNRKFLAPPSSRFFPLRIFFFFLLLLILIICTPSASAKTFYGKVLKVFDGDTFLVLLQGQEEHVRLREIDAPEVARRNKVGQEPWGRRARQFAQSKVRGKTVLLEVEEREERDKYHRLLAYVFSEHIFINREMVISGNAFFYPGVIRGKHASQLQEAEDFAREKALGVWDKKNGLQERPQEFRNRTLWDECFFPKFRPLIRDEKNKFSSKDYPLLTHKIVANKRSMVYHLPGCPGAARVSPRNRTFFNTPEEAEKAGFRRAKS